MSNMEQRLGPGMLYEGPSVEPGIVRTYPDGVMWLIKPDGTRCVIPCAGGGGGGAPVDAEYVVLALNGTLTAERVLAVGDALSLTDGGAGGNALLDVLVDGTTIQVNGLNQLEVVGGSAAPVSAQYVTMALDATLTDERVLTAGDGLDLTDGGAGGNALLDVLVDGLSIGLNGSNELEVIGGALTNAVIINPGTSVRNLIEPTGDFIPLLVKGSVGQTEDMFQVLDSSSTVRASILLGRNKVVTLAITGAPTGGSFTLTVSGFTTTALNFNATAAQVDAALEALPTVGASGVAATGGPLPGTPILIEHTGPWSAQQTSWTITSTNSLTGGAAPAISITTTTTPDPSGPLSNGIMFTDDGVYLHNGAAIKLGNSFNTSFQPVLYRDSANSVVLRAGSGNVMMVGDTSGRIGMGIGNLNTSLIDIAEGTLTYYNAQPTTGVTTGITRMSLVAGAGQGTSAILQTLSSFGPSVSGWQLKVDGTMEWGSAADVNLYRGGANQLKTDDDFAVGANWLVAAAGFINGAEIATPATPAANNGRLYFRDSGGGITQLIALWPSGNTTVVAEDF